MSQRQQRQGRKYSRSSSSLQLNQNESPPTIPKIPKNLWKFDHTPAVVSIGPYHHGSNSHLNDMDQLKHLYVKWFFHRTSSITKDECRSLLEGILPQIWSCYSAVAIKFNNKLLDTILHDGCFIVELLLAKSEYKRKNEIDLTTNLPRPHPWRHPPSITRGRKEDDPILGDELKLSLVKYDLLRVENQLPFFVLESMYKLVHGIRDSHEEEEMEMDCHSMFVELVIDFFDNLLPQNCCAQWLSKGINFYHLLHLFHSYATAISPPEQNINGVVSVQVDNTNVRGLRLIPHATELKELVGLKFKSKDDSSNFWNVTFQKEKGVMEVSPVTLDKNSISFYQNLIAFEQCFFLKVKPRVMGYAMLMGRLIDSEADWDLMRKHGVVDSPLKREEACKFFRDISNVTTLDYNCLYRANLGELSAQVLDYYDNKCQQRRTAMWQFMKSKCFSLATISVIVGAILFGTDQQVLGYLTYFKHKKSPQEQSQN